MKTDKKHADFLKFVSKEKSNLLANLDWEVENEDWLDQSSAIALQILTALDEKKWSKSELAEKLNVSPSYVSKMVKGRENFTLETICKLEKVLGLEILKQNKVAEASQMMLFISNNLRASQAMSCSTDYLYSVPAMQSNSLHCKKEIVWSHKKLSLEFTELPEIELQESTFITEFS